MDVEIRGKYREKLAENSALAENGECRIWCGAMKKSGNYGVMNVKLSRSSQWRCIVVHRVSYMVNHNTVSLSTDLDVSHLCHNSLCIKAEHLSLEPHHINNNRQYCKSKQQCLGHGVYACCRLSLALPKRYLILFCSIFCSLISCLLIHLDLVWSGFVRSCLCCQVRSGQVRSGQVKSSQSYT